MSFINFQTLRFFINELFLFLKVFDPWFSILPRLCPTSGEKLNKNGRPMVLSILPYLTKYSKWTLLLFFFFEFIRRFFHHYNKYFFSQLIFQNIFGYLMAYWKNIGCAFFKNKNEWNVLSQRNHNTSVNTITFQLKSIKRKLV